MLYRWMPPSEGHTITAHKVVIRKGETFELTQEEWNASGSFCKLYSVLVEEAVVNEVPFVEESSVVLDPDGVQTVTPIAKLTKGSKKGGKKAPKIAAVPVIPSDEE